MTAPGFADLYRWDVRHIGRSPLLWAVLLILGASFVWGAVSTANLHRAQAEAHARLALREAAHDEDLHRRIEAYRTPVTAAAPAIPYWQDPSNVSGFSQYFLFRHATKPHLPLSPLALGVSDLAPNWLPVKLNSVAGTDERYDFENPRGLALGRFDLGFALVYLLPIALILMFGLLVTFERDHGMLRLVAAQATKPRTWLATRCAAILSWALPSVLLAVLLALAAAGTHLAEAWPELLGALLLIACYTLFWSGVAILALSRLPSASGAIASLATVWILLALGLPLAGATLAAILDAAPSSSQRVDLLRRTNDAVQANRNTLLVRAFAARPDLRDAAYRIADIDHATRLSFLTPEIERRMAPLDRAIAGHAERQARTAAIAGYVVPPLGFAAALAELAGTDAQRQHDFMAKARAYQLALRDYLYPLVQHEIACPTPAPGMPLRGRFTFSRQGELPIFAFTAAPSYIRTAAILPLAVWLALLGAGFATLGCVRADRWPVDTA